MARAGSRPRSSTWAERCGPERPPGRHARAREDLFGITGDSITAFAINNSLVDVGMMLAMGVFGYFLEANGIPVAPIVLGMVLGPILEQNFMVSMIKTEWDRARRRV